MTIVLAVTWIANDGCDDEVAAILRELAPLSRAEPGCLQYDVHRDPSDPLAFFLFERYIDETAFEAHATSRHFQDLVVGRAIPLLASRQRTLLAPLV